MPNARLRRLAAEDYATLCDRHSEGRCLSAEQLTALMCPGAVPITMLRVADDDCASIRDS
jgi:hypothetical protein